MKSFDARQGIEYNVTKFKGQLYNECITHGKAPLLQDNDLEFIGTGIISDTDCGKP